MKNHSVLENVLTFLCLSKLLEKINKFEAEGREFAKILRSLEQFAQTVKGQNNVCYQNAFLTCSWRFLGSNKLEQLELKLEKINGI